MSYLRIPNSIIDKVESWERRKSHESSDQEFLAPRYRNNTISSTTYKMLGILFIGVPYFTAMLVIGWLPISADNKLFVMFIFVLITTIASIAALLYLKKR
ncbi:MAG: hypothetical protein ABIR46_00840, partial [Candidatus Saccharimonadales bacterium]